MRLVVNIPEGAEARIENGQVVLDFGFDDLVPRYRGIDTSLYYKGEKMDSKTLMVYAGKQIELHR